MSRDQEMKIRGELEVDLERDLEEEIKEGIYHLALKLHRLYQHQKERSSNTQKELLSEVNINIKMEGETTIQIKEIKKEAKAAAAAAQVRAGTTTSSSTKQNDTVVKVTPTRGVKFDWAMSLRSGSRSISRRGESSKGEKERGNDAVHVNSSTKSDYERKNGSGSGKVDTGRGKVALREMGWKY